MSINFKEYRDELIFLPLGGSNEIGMNLNCYHYQGKWLLIDCGIGFADAYYPGVELVLPNTAFLREQKKNIIGLVLTHAHEDHVGGVSYLWDDLGCPIYATPFTAAFLKYKLVEAGLHNEVKVTEVQPGAYMQLGPFGVEMVPLTHSIPEMQAIAIRTEKGTVMHTGDWKFDEDPLVGPQSDEATLRRYGDEGVLAMVCDSTNVFVEGVAGSEAGVRENLVKLISGFENRVVVTTFASNIARLETLIQAGRQAGRQIALAGRSLWRILEAGRESGYLRDTGEMLNEKQAMDVPRGEIMLICTGCQGEPLAALSKISRGEHHSIRLSPGDTVIFASRKIPGNEKRIGWVQNNLVERGMEVITDGQEHVHVSGHPARAELKRMYELVRPRIAIPTHGETRHIHEQSKFARSLGVPQTIELRNGMAARLSGDNPGIIGMVETGYMVVDGGTLLPADSPVIRARRRLRDEGCVIVSLAVDKRNALAAPVQVIAPGVFDPKADEDILAACAEAVAEAVENLKRSDRDEAIKESVRKAVRQVIRKELDKRPLLEVLLSRV